FELRPECFAEAAAKFLNDPACALRVDLARHLDGGVVAIISSSQRAAERVGFLLGAIPRAQAAGLAVGAGPLVLPHLLLKLLGKPLRAPAHGIDGAALAVDGAVGIAIAERAFRVAHGAVGIRKVVAALALALLTWLALLTLLALLALLTFLILAETAF